MLGVGIQSESNGEVETLFRWAQAVSRGKTADQRERHSA
jgi:hypothetical protein